MARYDIDKKPHSLDELSALIVAAQKELSDLCNGKRFRMTIPVEDTDSDVMIGDALRHSLALVRSASERDRLSGDLSVRVTAWRSVNRDWLRSVPVLDNLLSDIESALSAQSTAAPVLTREQFDQVADGKYTIADDNPWQPKR